VVCKIGEYRCECGHYEFINLICDSRN
jgi:hypothetical protein